MEVSKKMNIKGKLNNMEVIKMGDEENTEKSLLPEAEAGSETKTETEETEEVDAGKIESDEGDSTEEEESDEHIEDAEEAEETESTDSE